MGDEIRTFLGKIPMRLKQNKNWNYLVKIAFSQNINEGGWRWCNAESSHTCLFRASALLVNAHEVYCGQDLIREPPECASLKHIHHPCFTKQSEARQHLKPSDVFKSILNPIISRLWKLKRRKVRYFSPTDSVNEGSQELFCNFSTYS